MIKNVFKTVLILILTVGPALFLSADRIDEVIKNAPGAKDYPEAAAIDLFTEITIDVNDDYSYTGHVYTIRKILNYKGKKEYSDVTLSYNADHEKITPGNCFTVTASGERIPIPENQINDLNSRTSIRHPLINYRETVINYPGVEPGHVIVLDYTVHNHRKKPVTGVEHFQGGDPNLHQKVTLRFPAKFKPVTYFDKDKLTFTKTKKDKTFIYTWTAEKVPMIKPESGSPTRLISGLPLVYSFYKDWRQLAKEKLIPVITAPVPAAVVIKAVDLTKHCKNHNEKMQVLYNFLADNFNYMYSFAGENDAPPRPLAQILEEKKGSQVDQVALFIGMAKAVGIKDIHPALTLSFPDRFSAVQEKVPAKEFLGRLLVHWDNRLFAMGMNYMPFGFVNYDVNILLGNRGFEFRRFHHPDRLTESHRLEYKLNGGNADVTVRSVLADSRNRAYRRAYQDQPQARRKMRFNQGLGDPSAVLTDGPNFRNFGNIDEDLKLDYGLQYENFLTPQEPYYYFKFPPPGVGIDVSLEKRENDLQIFRKDHTVEVLSFDLDKPYGFINPLEQLKYEFPIGERTAFFKLDSRKEGNRITVKRELYIPEGIINREDYAAFKAFILKIRNPINSMIFLQDSATKTPRH